MVVAFPDERTKPSLEVLSRSPVFVGSIWSRAGRVVCLVVADLLAVTTAGLLAYWLWARPVLGQPAGLYLELLPLATLFSIGFASSGLYPGFGLGAVETLRRLSRATSLILVTMAALVFILKIQDFYSRVAFGLFWLGVLALVPMWHGSRCCQPPDTGRGGRNRVSWLASKSDSNQR